MFLYFSQQDKDKEQGQGQITISITVAMLIRMPLVTVLLVTTFAPLSLLSSLSLSLSLTSAFNLTLQVPVLAFLLQVLVLPELVEARNPDGNRHHFLFDVNDGDYNEDDDHPINAYATHVFYAEEDEEEEEEELEDNDNEGEEEGEEYESLTLALVKEFNPSLVHSLTDEIYEEYNYNLNDIEDVRIKPLFLVDTDSDVDVNVDVDVDLEHEHVNVKVHRVVLWYHPYCANCQRFKSTFLKLAQDTINTINLQQNGNTYANTYANANANTNANSNNFTIEFHAISCSKHHWLCEEYELYDEFPIVWVYDYRTKRNSYDYTILQDYTVQGLADILGFRVYNDNRDVYAHEYVNGYVNEYGNGNGNGNGNDEDRGENQRHGQQKQGAQLETAETRSRTPEKDATTLSKGKKHNNDKGGGGDGNGNFDDYDYDDDNRNEIIDIFGASNDIYKRTRNDIFHDAAISFMYSIRSSSRENDDNNDDEERIETLSEYFDLLYWSLPPSWKILTIVKDVRFTLQDHALSSSQQETYHAIHLMMKNAVNSHQSFVLNHEYAGWTPSCRFASTPSTPSTLPSSLLSSSSSSSKLVTKKDGGYQCGLWNLLHIISIGVAERHKAVLGGRDRVSTEHAAISIRNYLSHFILDGSISSGNRNRSGSSNKGSSSYWKKFLDVYNRDCGHHRYWGGNGNKNCKRFQRTKNKKSSQYYTDINHWKEFPLWLWEIHNEMNVHVFTEQMKQSGETCCTKDDERKVLFPSDEDCPTCRLEDGNWDREQVYLYLKGQYWPSGIHNFRYVVLDVKDQDNNNGKQDHIPDYIVDIAIGLTLVCLLIYYKRLHNETRGQKIKAINKKHND